MVVHDQGLATLLLDTFSSASMPAYSTIALLRRAQQNFSEAALGFSGNDSSQSWLHSLEVSLLLNSARLPRGTSIIT